MKKANQTKTNKARKSRNVTKINMEVEAAMAQMRGGAFGRLESSLTGLDSDMAEVISSFVLPIESPPIRTSSVFATAPSAVAAPWARRDLPMYTAADANPNDGAQLSGPDGFIAQFRDPVRHTVVYDSTYENSTYSLMFPNNGSGSNRTTLIAGNETPLSLLKCNWLAGYAPHGSAMYPGYTTKNGSGALRFFWIDSATGLSEVQTTFNGLAAALTINTYKWQPSGNIRVNSQTAGIAATSLNLPIASSGYYAFSYSSTGNAILFGGNIVMDGTDYFAHKPIAYFEENIAVLDGIMMTSFAHLVTNKSPELYLQGSIAQAQVPQGSDWQEFLSFDSVSKLAGSIERIAKNGSYSYAKPTQPGDFEFSTDVSSEEGVLERCMFPLDTPSAFLVTFLSIPGKEGRSFFVTESSHITYQTTDVWRDLESPRIDHRVYEQSLDYLKSLDQFFENKTHAKSLLSRIRTFVKRKVIPGIEKYGPKAIKFVGKYGPEAVKAAKMIGTLL